MSSDHKNSDITLDSDVRQQNMVSVEDKHFSDINERGDHDMKSGIQSMTENMITMESKTHNQPLSEPVIHTPTLDEADISVDDTQAKGDNVDPHVNVRNPKEYDSSIDERLPETVTLLTTPDGGKLYLVGTAHFSVESQNDVSMIIQAVQPHIIAVELCARRIGILKLNEQDLYHCIKKLSYKSIVHALKTLGPYNGLVHILFFRMASHIAKQLGIAPGGEFRRAFQESKKIPNCPVLLADRPVNITVQRVVRSLSWWQAFKLGWELINLKGCITKEDVELCKQRSLLKAMINKLKNEFPAINEVLIKERDIYLTHSLQLACMPRYTANGIVPARVVGIVGIGHTPGIMQNWGKVKPSDIPPILSIPPQSLSTKILKFTVKASFLGAVVYMGCKIILMSSGITLQSIKSSVKGLLKILVSMEATACTDEYDHPIPGVMYIVNNIPGPGIDIENFESEYSLGCSCTAECSNCSCTRGSPNYINGQILDEKMAGPIIECNSHCMCVQDCGNRLVQNGPLDSLIVSKTNNKGFGLFTSKLIKKGQFICEYAGEVISIEEARCRTETNKRDGSMNYVLVVSEHVGDRTIVTCIDPKYFGNIGRYCNHSCEPNASLVPIRVEGVVPRLCLFACKDIKAGEEVTFNYAGGVANSVHDFSGTPCLCGTTNCSGYLPHNPI